MLHACWGCVPPVRTRRLPPKPAKPEPNRDFERTPPSAEQFVHREAQLLDERRFDQWPELFTDDSSYWIGGRSNRYPNRGTEFIEGSNSSAR